MNKEIKNWSDRRCRVLHAAEAERRASALHCTKPGRAEIWPGCFNSETVDREHEPELVSLSAGRLPSAQTAP